MLSENVMVWNVRGLNDVGHRNVLRDLVASNNVSLVCIQETKMAVISRIDVLSILGSGFDYAFLPAAGSRGGILVAWKSDVWLASNFSYRAHSITMQIQELASSSVWHLTTVYGPTQDADKEGFLQEIREVQAGVGGPWMINGDFNMIYQAADKSNGRLHHRQMGRFRRLLSDLELKELHLHGRLFTWSNERSEPTLERIDRIFVSLDWEDLYPNSFLQSMYSACSDHAPLLLQSNAFMTAKKRFHFESIWVRRPGFLDVVKEAWHCPLVDVDPFQRLDWLLRNTSRELQRWSGRFVGSVRLQLAIAKEVVHRLEMAQDHRDLLLAEHALRKKLKLKALALASLHRVIARQRSRILHLAAGDANTKFFHSHASHRRNKRYIPSLSVGTTCVHGEEEKAEVAFNFFSSLIGSVAPRSHSLDFAFLEMPCLDLQELAVPFTEEEVEKIVKELSSDKAPGPDGFTGLFLKMAWPIIKPDVLRAFQAFSDMDTRSFHLINGALMILLPKNREAKAITDYRPISLIHCLGKLFSKAMACRLMPKMNLLVKPNQSAFIKNRNIEDNFRMVRGAAKLLHARGKPMVLLKVDITKAFDSVSWSFLLDLLQYMGFPLRWTNWVSVLLSTASSKISLNGHHGQRICHARGLRQGDPLSPLLFVFTMEVLNAMFCKADEKRLLSPLKLRAVPYRVSLYADDVVAFLKPSVAELATAKAILGCFEGATGLATNLSKCSMSPIRCSEEQLQIATTCFPCKIEDFPCKYLGVPLSIYKLSKAEEQPLVDKVAERLPTWMARLLTRAGRLVLTKVTLTSLMVYPAIALQLSPWAIRAIDKLRRAFLWKGTAVVSGGTVWWPGRWFAARRRLVVLG